MTIDRLPFVLLSWPYAGPGLEPAQPMWRYVLERRRASCFRRLGPLRRVRARDGPVRSIVQDFFWCSFHCSYRFGHGAQGTALVTWGGWGTCPAGWRGSRVQEAGRLHLLPKLFEPKENRQCERIAVPVSDGHPTEVVRSAPVPARLGQGERTPNGPSRRHYSTGARRRR